ncbi:MAG TPA: hypothetical protein VFE96_02360 [Candidatus Bathyarchaeia archaeon]|jgi:hypothetical protein|nr:hypothetical protein [Candidatus Bathyarchaeia archaeon]
MALTTSPKLQRISLVFGIVGGVGAIIQAGGLVLAFLFEGGISRDPYYNPFTSAVLFLIASVIVAATLGFAGGILSRRNPTRGSIILFTAVAVGLVSYVPYVTLNGILFGVFFFSLAYPPWWTVLLLSGGIFAFLSRSVQATPTLTGKDPRQAADKNGR